MAKGGERSRKRRKQSDALRTEKGYMMKKKTSVLEI